MKKFGFTLKELMMVVAIFAILLVLCAPAIAQDTKFASGSTSAAVTFGPVDGKTVVKSVCATTDKAGGVVKFYARSVKLTPTATPTNGATVIACDNSALALTTNDVVVYVHANGTLDQTTVSDRTTTNVTLTAGITVAGASGDHLYKLTQHGQILVGMLGTGVGTNDVLNLSGEAVFATPGNSPLYVVLDGTSACVLQVTAKQ